MIQMAPGAAWPEWLEKLWWREAWLTMEAAEPAILPPYLGSTIRGALGHLLRAGLCDGSGCGHDCQRPGACRYHSLFEGNSAGAKPFILLSPPPPALEEIALGGPVNLPFQTGQPRRGETIPTLRCDAGWKFDAGARVDFGLRLIGTASSALPAIIAAVGQCGLSLGGARFRLHSCRDDSGQLLFDCRLPKVPVQPVAPRTLMIEEQPARRVRVVFLSPTVFKLDRAPTFSPEDFARRFFEHSLGRAVGMYSTCWADRLPWVEPPVAHVELVGHRLFHYDLPRHSFRQDKWLDFDGVVGYIDLEGEIGPLLAWGRAAEVFHFGQKAAFGLGKVRLLVLA